MLKQQLTLFSQTGQVQLTTERPVLLFNRNILLSFLIVQQYHMLHINRIFSLIERHAN